MYMTKKTKNKMSNAVAAIEKLYWSDEFFDDDEFMSGYDAALDLCYSKTLPDKIMTIYVKMAMVAFAAYMKNEIHMFKIIRRVSNKSNLGFAECLGMIECLFVETLW